MRLNEPEKGPNLLLALLALTEGLQYLTLRLSDGEDLSSLWQPFAQAAWPLPFL